MEKTPVTILQEKMVKEKVIPKYDIISSTAGTHLNAFTYRVYCKELVAEGTANNKKQAKHNAAAAMLKLLEFEATTSSKPKSTLSLQSPKITNSDCVQLAVEFINYIGKLQELCAQNNYSIPVYSESVAVGTTLKPEFKIKCSVSTFQEEASATTKKQAKQLAAQKLYRRLLKQREKEDDSVSIPDVCTLLGSLKIQSSYDVSSTEKAIAMFKRINKVFVPVKKAAIADSHLFLKSSYYTKVDVKQLEAMKEPTVFHDPICAQKIVKNIESIFRFSVEQISIPTRTDLFMFGLKINQYPVILEIGIGNTLGSAQVMATDKLVKTLILMMS